MELFKNQESKKNFSASTTSKILIVVWLVLALGLGGSLIYIQTNKSADTVHAGSYQFIGRGSVGAINPTNTVAVSVYACLRQSNNQSFVDVLSEVTPSVSQAASGVYGGYDINYLSKSSSNQSLTDYLPGYVAADKTWGDGYSQAWQSENLNLIPSADRSSADLSVAITGQNNLSYSKLGLAVSSIKASCS